MKTTVFFDFEGSWENPYRTKLNLDNIIKNITNILDTYKIKAVFNTCGAIANQRPDLIKQLFDNGHEIASHAYCHENLVQLSYKDLNLVLDKTEKAIKRITGKKVIGIRSPWLFQSNQLYYILKKRRYKWVSNKHMVFPEVFSRPDYSKNILSLYSVAKKVMLMKRLFTWRGEPHIHKGLIEIPLQSSMDGELLSLMSPLQKTPTLWLNYAYSAIKKQFKIANETFNLNFHPWMIGSSNRVILLKKILKYLKDNKTNFVLAKDLVNEWQKN